MHLRTHRGRTPALLLVLALAAVLLAACGSSSSTTTGSNASASATAPGGSGSTGATGATGARGGRFKAVRECLAKQGITLPTPPSGTRRPGAGGGFLGGGASGGGPNLPAGVTRQQFEAALKKCGAGGRFGKRRSLANNPAFEKSLAAFSTCMSEHGVKLPAPNTSGKGPVFNTSGINTKSKAFRAADEACRSKIRFFAPRAGGEGAARPGGAPPGATPPAEGAPENG